MNFQKPHLETEEEDEINRIPGGDTEEKKPKSRQPSGCGKRGGWGGGSGICCQAEKCAVELTDAKRYHRRHKVCDFHAKAPSVLVGGLRQRFCQQCSRFHELSEFDEAKRSCRRRLAGHNERRRKSTSNAQGEGGSGSGSSTRTKQPEPNSNPQCRPSDNVATVRVQMTSYTASNPTTTSTKHFQIR